MTDRTFTAKDMPTIEKAFMFQRWDAERKEALATADATRQMIEGAFPAAEGWYWCVGVDGEMYLKEGS